MEMKRHSKQGLRSMCRLSAYHLEVMKRFPLLPLEEEGRLKDMWRARA
jgi:hypothetical protein